MSLDSSVLHKSSANFRIFQASQLRGGICHSEQLLNGSFQNALEKRGNVTFFGIDKLKEKIYYVGEPEFFSISSYLWSKSSIQECILLFSSWFSCWSRNNLLNFTHISCKKHSPQASLVGRTVYQDCHRHPGTHRKRGVPQASLDLAMNFDHSEWTHQTAIRVKVTGPFLFWLMIRVWKGTKPITDNVRNMHTGSVFLFDKPLRVKERRKKNQLVGLCLDNVTALAPYWILPTGRKLRNVFNVNVPFILDGNPGRSCRGKLSLCYRTWKPHVNLHSRKDVDDGRLSISEQDARRGSICGEVQPSRFGGNQKRTGLHPPTNKHFQMRCTVNTI